MTTQQPEKIEIPRPFVTGGLPLSEAINLRRSIRRFAPEPILLFQLAQILWAAQGTADTLNAKRTVPSAGATYPLEIYVIIGDSGVENIDSGVYHYDVPGHTLSRHISGDLRADIANAAYGQDFIAVAPVSLVICAVYDKTMIRYNVRGERYVFIEVGHAGQNIYLQTTALGLGTVAIGAFRDEEVRSLLQLDSRIRPLYIMPLGKAV
jgi:SagB-type dehydrogenase family enzyme